MPPRARGKERIPSEDDVRLRWTALGMEQRKMATQIEDAVMVSRLRSVIDTFCHKQSWMRHMGLVLGEEDPSLPFVAGSKLFTECFYLPCSVAKSEEIPGLQFIDPDNQPPWMALREEVLTDGGVLFVQCKRALPDFLAPQAGPAGRVPTPRARWKDLWAVEPSTVSALEQQLAKLVEQVLWQMASDHPNASATPAIAEESAQYDTAVGEVTFEDWMSDKVPKKKSKKKKKQPAIVPVVSEALPDIIEQGATGGEMPAEAVAEKVLKMEMIGEFAVAEDVVEDDGNEEDGVEGDDVKDDVVRQHGSADDGIDEGGLNEQATEKMSFKRKIVADKVVEKECGEACVADDLHSGQVNDVVDPAPLDCTPPHVEAIAFISANGGIFQPTGGDMSARGDRADSRLALLEAENARLRAELAVERSHQQPQHVAQAQGPCPSNAKDAWNTAADNAEREVLATHYWSSSSPKRSHWQSFRQILHLDVEPRQRFEHPTESPVLAEGDLLPLPTTPPRTPPNGSGAGLQPQQLVRYIWNQTGQMEERKERYGSTPTSTTVGTGAVSAASGSTPWSHGYWSSPLGSRAVVKNTFIDICSAEADALPRRTKSVSPPRYWGGTDDDPDYWFR